MASTREPVSFPRILRGGGREANCTIRAIKRKLLPGKLSVFEYVDYSIENVSKALPDSVYELSANGRDHRGAKSKWELARGVGLSM